MEYYSDLKRKEILMHITTWMSLENIILSKISKSEKDKYCLTPLIWGTREIKFMEPESRMVVAKGWGKWGMGVLI